MAQALDNGSCVGNIKGALTVPILREHLFIWDLVDGLNLQQGIEDQHRWRLSSSGNYLANQPTTPSSSGQSISLRGRDQENL